MIQKIKKTQKKEKNRKYKLFAIAFWKWNTYKFMLVHPLSVL